MSNKPKCFTRYNNSGNPYTICADKEWKQSDRKDKKPSEPLISVEQFLDKLNKTYSQLSKNQRQEYHRIDMANRRKKEALLTKKAIKDLSKVKAELKQEKKQELDKLKKSFMKKKTKAQKDLSATKNEIISNAVKKYKEGFDVDETKLKETLGENKYAEYILYTKNNPGAVNLRKEAIKKAGAQGPKVVIGFD